MTKKMCLKIFLILLPINPCYGIYSKSAVCSGPQVGRLGNCLWNYCLAKWVAKKTNLPVRHTALFRGEEKDFAYSQLEPLAQARHFRRKIMVNGRNFEQLINRHKSRNTLFVVPFGFKAPGWTSHDHIIRILKQDKELIKELQGKIKPVFAIAEIEKPKNALSVALHVRQAGQVAQDPADIYKRFPNKFPPESYYIEQLIKLSFMLNHAPMFVYIFTDSSQPQAIAQRFKELVNLPNIEYAYRETGNAHNSNVIEDLFNMATFDYLIRPDSSYTRIVEIIGDHKMVIYPKKAHIDVQKRLFFITDVGVHIYDKTLLEFRSFLKKSLSKKMWKGFVKKC